MADALENVDRRPLHYVCHKGRLEEAKYLMEKGVLQHLS